MIDTEMVETLYDTMLSDGTWMGVDCDAPVTSGADASDE